MKKLRRILTLTFCGMGLLFLLISVGVEVWYSSAASGLTAVDGVVEEIGVFRRGQPTVVYTVDGQNYRLYSNSSGITYRVGDAYQVLVDPANPAKALDPQLRLLSVIFAIIGLVMMAAGAVCYLLLMRKQRRLDLLRASGLRAEAAVLRVYQNRSVRLNGHSPWIVEAECLHPHTREKLTAKSGWLWETRLQPGDRVEVLIDPMTGRRMVDLEDNV